jgi:hypothetical protein
VPSAGRREGAGGLTAALSASETPHGVPRGRLYVGTGVDWRTGVAWSGPGRWEAMVEEGWGDEGALLGNST